MTPLSRPSWCVPKLRWPIEERQRDHEKMDRNSRWVHGNSSVLASSDRTALDSVSNLRTRTRTRTRSSSSSSRGSGSVSSFSFERVYSNACARVMCASMLEREGEGEGEERGCMGHLSVSLTRTLTPLSPLSSLPLPPSSSVLNTM